jgi:hypothetical protein
MTLQEMMNELVSSGLIENPDRTAYPREPDNFVYVPTSISYGVTLNDHNASASTDAQLERRTQ